MSTNRHDDLSSSMVLARLFLGNERELRPKHKTRYVRLSEARRELLQYHTYKTD